MLSIQGALEKLTRDPNFFDEVACVHGSELDPHTTLVTVMSHRWSKDAHPPSVKVGQLYIRSDDGRGYDWSIVQATSAHEGTIWAHVVGTAPPEECLRRALLIAAAVNSVGKIEIL